MPIRPSRNPLLARWEKISRKLRRWYSGRGGLRNLRRLVKQKQWEQLESGSARILARDPDHHEARLWLAVSLLRQRHLETALGHVLTASAGSLGGFQKLAHTTAAACLSQLGRLEEACVHLHKAVDFDPENQSLMLDLLAAAARAHGVQAAADIYVKRFPSLAKDAVVAPILSVRAWAARQRVALLEVGEAEDIPFQEPRVWNQPGQPTRHRARSNKPYVAEIVDARVFSHSGLVLTADGTALCDNGGDPQFGEYVKYLADRTVIAQSTGEVLLELGNFRERALDAGVFLAGSASAHYGHWLPEYLPRLRFFQCHPDFAKLPIIVDADMPRSHFDHLRRLADNPLIELQADESLRCGRLLVAPPPTFSPVDMLPHDIPVHEMPGLSPAALRFLRQGAQADAATPRNGRYFLARKKMSWRRLLNEDQIATTLVGLGFEIIFIEDLDMRSQIALFQRAAWIVAPNGSALLNLIFSEPSVKLLILSQSEMFNWGTFEGPMRSLGYDPVWICAEEKAAEGGKHANYSVPAALILAALAEMGLPEARG